MFEFCSINYEKFNLKFLKSDIFQGKIVHLFSTRVGGDTPLPLSSFTLSAKDYMDFDDFAVKNQRILCNILGGKYENMIMPNQQHTDNILVLKDKIIDFDKSAPFDGVITNIPNIPIMLVFADCIPILIFDNKKNVMGIVHAGWKGTAKKIAQKAVKIMKDDFDCDINSIDVAIGAGISAKNYETSIQNIDSLLITIDKIRAKDVLYKERNIDLKRINAIQLNECGVNNIDICPFCTYDNNDLFYSYRKENKITGRHALIGMLKE